MDYIVPVALLAGLVYLVAYFAGAVLRDLFVRTPVGQTGIGRFPCIKIMPVPLEQLDEFRVSFPEAMTLDQLMHGWLAFGLPANALDSARADLSADEEAAKAEGKLTFYTVFYHAPF